MEETKADKTVTMKGFATDDDLTITSCKFKCVGYCLHDTLDIYYKIGNALSEESNLEEEEDFGSVFLSFFL